MKWLLFYTRNGSKHVITMDVKGLPCQKAIAFTILAQEFGHSAPRQLLERHCEEWLKECGIEVLDIRPLP